MEVCVNTSKPEAVTQLRTEGTGESAQLLTSYEAASPPARPGRFLRPFHSDLDSLISMSVEKDKSIKSSDDSQIIADIVLAEDVSLDEEHKNAGGAPVEDKSPIGQDVGWWTAVFLSMFISNVQFAQAEPTDAHRLLTHDRDGYVLLWIV